MAWFSRPSVKDQEAFEALADGLEAFATALPSHVRRTFKRSAMEVWLEIPAPTKGHRRLYISGTPGSFEYELGRIWSEPTTLTLEGVTELLAACDAVLEGRVREIRDLRTRIRYHVYSLRSRGLWRFARDTEYSLIAWMKLKVRKVKIQRLPPLFSSPGEIERTSATRNAALEAFLTPRGWSSDERTMTRDEMHER